MTFGEDPLKESLATHSSILAWRIPWTEEPGRLWSRASKRVIHAWSDLAPIHWWLIPSEQCMIVVHCSVAKLCLTLQPHGLQQARLPCPSLSPGICSKSYPLSWWCHPTISSSLSPFSSYSQSLPASGSFPMSWLFTSGSQSIGASASTSVHPVNIQGWYLLGLTAWSPCSLRNSQESSPAP